MVKFDVRGRISYIFIRTFMISLANILRSSRAKKIYIAFALCLLLFFVCNDLLMPWYVNQRGEVTVISVEGLLFEDASRLLDSVGLRAQQGDVVRTDKAHPPGTVINQNPPAGKKVNKGRRIYLTISGEEQLVEVPNLKGRTVRDARFQLERQGLKLGEIEYQASDEFPENTIIGQRIPPNTKVKKDVYIGIIVSQGRLVDKVEVPNVLHQPLAQAEQILTSRGLKVGNITYQPVAELLPNSIIDQFPRPGEFVLKGQAIDLFVVEEAGKRKEILEN
jgi:beta-lactam-binding protein with PASTA domain